MKKFTPKSPDPHLRKDADMAPAKFGHLNEIVKALKGAEENVYPDNATALTEGLKPGDFYRDDFGVVRVVFEV